MVAGVDVVVDGSVGGTEDVDAGMEVDDVGVAVVVVSSG